MEMRRRVKEQLKKLGGMEFYDVNFSYIDLEDMSEHCILIQIDVYGLIKDEMNVKRISGENGRSGLLPSCLF